MKTLSTAAIVGAGVISFVCYFAYLSYGPGSQPGAGTRPAVEAGRAAPAVPMATTTTDSRQSPSQGDTAAAEQQLDGHSTHGESAASTATSEAPTFAAASDAENAEPKTAMIQDPVLSEEYPAAEEGASGEYTASIADEGLATENTESPALREGQINDPIENQAIPPEAIVEEQYNPVAETEDDELMQVFSEQAYDENWAPETEARINETFESAELETSQLLEASCKSTLCRIEVSHSSTEAEQQFLSRFSQQSLLQSGGVAGNYQKIVDDSGEIRSVFYFARQDSDPSEATQEAAE